MTGEGDERNKVKNGGGAGKKSWEGKGMGKKLGRGGEEGGGAEDEGKVTTPIRKDKATHKES